jgi:hypothetical protein
MSGCLDADSLRRQANTVVGLTVVTILELIGSVTTGFVGMKLLAEADAPMERKQWILALGLVVATVLTFCAVGKSKGLSDFLDALSDERISVPNKLKVLTEVWRRASD